MSGTSSAGSRVVDLDGDGILDIIVASDDGWVMSFYTVRYFLEASGATVRIWASNKEVGSSNPMLVTSLCPWATHFICNVSPHPGVVVLVGMSINIVLIHISSLVHMFQ